MSLADDRRGAAPPVPTERTTLDAPVRPAGVPPSVRRVLGGRYEVRGVLGQGGMGEVWLARDLKLQVEVALKVVRPEKLGEEGALARLRAEVRAARAVASPHVCRVYDLVEADGLECVSMEYVDGTTLRHVLGTRTPLDLGEAREIAHQLLAGLEAIHGAGLVHRDVKPENIMLTRAGRVVLMDFGIAKTAASGGTVAGTPAYWAPEQAAGAPADRRADIFAAGLVLAEMVAPSGVRDRERREALLKGLREDPPDMPEGPWSEAIRKAVAREPGERFPSAQALARALEEIAQRATGTGIEKAQPYPGLSSFTEADAQYFFGREAEVEGAWKRLPGRHLLAVVGPSGAGKSSFLRAGLIPAKPEGWAHLVCTPGDAPFVALGQALVPEVSRDTNAMRLMLRFEDADVAVDLFRRWRSDHREALVIVDQFEELFTLNPQEVQARFASLLGRLVLEADVHVLLAMRDDFLLRCQEHEALRPIFEGLLPLGSPTGDALRRALVQPSLKCGYRFEDETLVTEMRQAVEGERGALPLLAFAAATLWERRDRENGLLTRAAYEAIRGVGGALAQHAEATLDKIGPEKLAVLRELFRNLVTAEGTRAVRDVDDLLTLFPEGERPGAENVFKTLIDARLLTSYEAHATEPGQRAGRRVEVVHESLLSAWPRLVRWRTEDEAGAQLRDQLRQASRLWEEKGRTEDLLWTGTAYQEFRLWRGRYPGVLTALEEDFAKAMAAKALRKRRLAVAAAAAVVIVSIGVAIVVGVSRQKAVAAAQRAEAAKLLALAQLRIAEDPTEALALSTASLELADTTETRLFALRALWQGPPAWEIDPGIEFAKLPFFSPDGRQLAVPGHSSVVGVFSENGGPPVRLPDHANSPRGGNVAGWASDDLLVTGLWKNTGSSVQVWSMPAGRKLRTIDFGAPSFWQVGPGRLFARTEFPSAPGLFDLRTWRLPDGEGEALGRLDSSKPGMTWNAFEPHGRGWLYSVGATTYFVPLPVGREAERVFSRHAGDVSLWNLPVRQELLAQTDKTGESHLLFFPENGPPVTKILPKPASAPAYLFYWGSDHWVGNAPDEEGVLRLWEMSALPGARPLELKREGSWLGAFPTTDPSARVVVSATHAMTRLTFWPLPARPPSVVDFSKSNGGAAFSPDGKRLAVGWPLDWNHLSLRLWPLPGTGAADVKVLDVPDAPAWGLGEFDPKGRFVIATGMEDSAWIKPLDDSPVRKFEGYSKDGNLCEGAVSPTGRFVAAAFSYGKGSKTLRVWDVETGKVRLYDLPVPQPPGGTPPQSPTGYEGGVWSVAFLDDSTLFTSGQGGIRRWDLNSGSNEMVKAWAHDHVGVLRLSSDRREILWCETDGKETSRSVSCAALDLATGATRPLGGGGGADPNAPPANLQPFVATRENVVVLVGRDGSVRVSPRSGGEPHLLLGHSGPVVGAAISPDLRWIVSTGEDNTLRLWPMPDLDKPPLHTLPQAELVAKLKSLTNLRAVRDPASSTGWKIELGPFSGWKNLPAWEP